MKASSLQPRAVDEDLNREGDDVHASPALD